jgi:succinoglycan biosynthesis protein ExoV
MKLLHFRGPNGERNFGDELGPWLWDRLLPGVLDDDSDELFVGIGTLLNNRLPRASRIVVFGSGVGYGDAPPTRDPSWSIYCLRGPLSATVLGLPPSLGITDPGALVRHFFPVADAPRPARQFSYMPHWRFACDDWERVCDRIGFGYIDPRRDVEEVIAAIRATRVLITEAMHGAIVADALRVPWIAVRSTPAILGFKWRDWCASLGLDYSPHAIVASLPLSTQPTPVRRMKHKARLCTSAARLVSVALLTRPRLSDSTVFDSRLKALDRTLERLRLDLA